MDRDDCTKIFQFAKDVYLSCSKKDPLKKRAVAIMDLCEQVVGWLDRPDDRRGQ